jgi:hypothetical protein
VLGLLVKRAPGKVLPSDEAYEGVFSHTEQLLSINELEQVLSHRGYLRKEAFYLGSYTYTGGSRHQAWA